MGLLPTGGDSFEEMQSLPPQVASAFWKASLQEALPVSQEAYAGYLDIALVLDSFYKSD